MGRRVERLGLLGGTFDPPHFGHLWLAETAREQLDLNKVCFLPVGDPVHKQNRSITAVSHRIQMTQLAIQNHPDFFVDTIDSERADPHTTVSLIPLLQRKYPDAQIWWIIGGDSLRDLPTWVNPQRLIQLCRIAALPRPNTTIGLGSFRKNHPSSKKPCRFIRWPRQCLVINRYSKLGKERALHSIFN